MLTSWSEQSTPAELSMKSVEIRPPFCAYSIRPRWVRPRLPPSPTTLHRNCLPLTRIASLDLSPTSACDSVDAFTYVPMPPFHSRSTGACRIAFISSFGAIVVTPGAIPRATRAGSDSGIDLAVRGQTPPPSEMSDVS
jgi:hypothetical protein